MLTKEEIRRRLNRMRGLKNIARLDDFTHRDVAKWIGVSRRDVQGHCNGSREITDAFRIIYSQFFHLVEDGGLVVEYDRSTKKKTLVRVAIPATPPKRKLMPAIDFNTMTLKLD